MVLKLKQLTINRFELLFLTIILLLSGFLRFWNLGYSHFYGDETKTLYLDKTVSAIDFLLDQRKGPVQFVVAWAMEKATGGFSEFYIRLPFAVAGTLSVLVFYLLAKKLFGVRASLISTFLYSISGFSIAFSRTAQYQSFLILFGLLSILFFIRALETSKSSWYILASLSFTVAMYSHYDAVFFLVPIIYMFVAQQKREIKKALLFFVLPLVAFLSVFYIPYILNGYLVSNTVNYVGRRALGTEFNSNSSLYTFFVYNHSLIHFVYVVVAVLYVIFFRTKDKIRDLFFTWFFITLIFYNVVVANPGTHIQNYFIPLYLASGASILWLFSLIKNKFFKTVLIIFSLLSGFVLLAVSLFVYVPGINNGYPWKNSNIGPLSIRAINKKDHHLYLYGFPYNRAWDQIRDYLYSKPGVRGYYTNDSVVTSKYYLQRFDCTPPGDDFLPQYYIYVVDSMEFEVPDPRFLFNYTIETEIVKDGSVSATIYKLKKPPVIVAN